MINAGDSFGSYKVVRKLGQGGMGEVWLLESASGRPVAAKFLDPESAGDHEARKRFLREAQLAIDVKHPNLVETYDVGEDPDTGLCYILMEYVSGGSLADYLKENGALPIEDAVAVVEAMAGVLELGRQKGIVHRDIKPANIMFDEEGTPKLADLGIARGGSAGTETTTVTQTGMMIGTPAYMAPEQMLDAHNVDTRADIYSLGVVFFEMLTGERPNKDDTVVQLMAKAVKGEPLPDVRTLRPEVSASLAQLLAMMVAPDKEGRISTPGQITNAIAIIERGGTLAEPKPQVAGMAQSPVAPPPVPKSSVPWRVIFPVVLLAGLAAAFVFLAPKKAEPNVPQKVVVKSVVKTNVVERVIEKTRVVTNAQRNTSGKSVQSRRPKVDRRVRIATVDDHDWYYTLEDDNAVIWRGENGYNSETRPAVRPEPTEHVTIPSVLDGHPVVALGSLAFFRCRKMTSVTIPEGVVRIDGWAFLDCTALNRVDVPESLRTLKPTAFCSCVSLTGIDLKNCVEFDGRSFYNCTKLDEVRIGKGRDELSTVDGALYADAGRRLVFWPRTRSSVSLPDGVKTIGGGAFQGCLASRIVLPKSVSELVNFAFDGCHNLEEVVLNEGIVSVGDYAFNMCYRLRAVVFPASLQRLGHDVFSRASAIRYVAFLGNAPEIGDVNRQSVFGKTQDSSEIVVRKGTTGWKSSGSTELPRLWPHEKMADSRPIRAVSDDEIVRLSTGLGRQEVLSGSSSASSGSEWQPGPSDKWFVKWDEALADARKRKRPILVLNTGSSWCHWCKKLRENVLDQHAFKSFADAKLTLLYLDSPCRNVAQRNHNKQVVKALKFSGGVPNARVFTAAGKFLGSIGGGDHGVEAYVGKLQELLAKKGEEILDDNGRCLFGNGYAALAAKIAEERAKLPKVARSDFKAKLVGVAVVSTDNLWSKNANFLPPETHIEVPFGEAALYKVEYDFPSGYGARVWTRADWPSGQGCPSGGFGSNPSGFYKGKGVTTGFMTYEGGTGCNLKSLAIRTASDPEIDDKTCEWKIGSYPVDIVFKGESTGTTAVVDRRKSSTPPGWLDDLEAAKEQARRENKQILAAFEGSDWCGWCKKMEQDVYTKPEFLPTVSSRFVPVYIDKPRDRTLLRVVVREKNPALHDEYGIRGVPCVMILDAEGREIGRVGGYKKSVEELMERVNGLPGVSREKIKTAVGDVDPEKLRNPDTTRQAQKALDALFPGWKVSRVLQDPNEDSASGFHRQHRERNNVVLIHPVNCETPAVLSRNVDLGKSKFPCLVLETASRAGDTDFQLSVRVNSKVVLPPRLICTPDSAPWERIVISLSRWKGTKAAVEIVLVANNWFNEHAYLSKIEIVEGSGKEKDGPVGIRSTDVFPHAELRSSKWKTRSPCAYTTREPPENWKDVDFDDSKWKHTKKALGFDRGQDMAVAEPWQSDWIWIRRKFNWKDSRSVYKAVLDLYYDQDIRVYLNGMPVLDMGGWNTTWVPYAMQTKAFAAALRQGENVLAVTLKGDGSSYFDCGLTIETCAEKTSMENVPAKVAEEALPRNDQRGDSGTVDARGRKSSFSDVEIERMKGLKGDKAVQKVVDRLFPGWRVSGCIGVADDGWNAIGYMSELCGRRNVCCTLPKGTDDPVRLTKTVVVSKNDPCLSFSVRKTPYFGSGFRIEVFANGKRIHECRRDDDNYNWLDESVDLTPWKGEKVRFEIRHSKLPDFKNARALWSRLEVK